MNNVRISWAMTTLAATTLLAGCGGSQPPIGAPGAMTQSPAIGSRRATSSSDLLYVATSNGILMLTYPAAKQVGTVPSQGRYPYVCADSTNGNVFVAENGAINEYAHGGTSIIQTLSPPSSYVNLKGCSVDPATGNLAVAASNTSGEGAILVYVGARGNATRYVDSELLYYYDCAYDSQSNLFVIGSGNKKHAIVPKYAQLQKGSSRFTNITLNEYLS